LFNSYPTLKNPSHCDNLPLLVSFFFTDLEEVYQEQLKESKLCTQTPTITFIGTDVMLSTSDNVVLQSLCIGSATSSDQGWGDSEQPMFSVLKFVRPVLPILPSLPSIDEVNSPPKDEIEIEIVELQKRIRRLKEEDAKFERVQKLREEATKLEWHKKMREEVRIEGVTRVV